MTARFIAIEGLDGSGGSTQLARLCGGFLARGEPCVVSREPSDGPVGKLIRAQLKGGVSDGVLPYLFAADRRDHFDAVILPALARGENVLSDRCALSSFAYQAEAHGLEKVMRLNADFPAPDLVILLDLDPEICLARILARGLPRDRFETLERLHTIAAGYDAAVDALRAAGNTCGAGWNIARVDASGTADQVAGRIAEAVWPG